MKQFAETLLRAKAAIIDDIDFLSDACKPNGQYKEGLQGGKNIAVDIIDRMLDDFSEDFPE